MAEHKGRTLADLRANERNPRIISEHKRRMLQRSLARFGDLGGIIYNRRTQQLVGGHQRIDALRILSDKQAEVIVESSSMQPQQDGSVAHGFVLHGGTRYGYREVDWDEATEQAANIAANKGAGEWKVDLLKLEMAELQTMDIDLDLTMFDADERAALLGEEKEDDEPDEPKLEEQFKVIVECRDEEHQAELLAQFDNEGLTCKALVG